jgi:aryl-alcohol dehydrogenase-like predicted oxidoreductase
MEYRFHNGEKISEIGLGGYSLSGVYGEKEPETFVEVVRRAYDLGVNFFDVADIYGPAEKILGRAVFPFRQMVLIATKVGWGAKGNPDCSSEHIMASCDKSLERLGTDYIDLYQIHFDDPETPVEESVGSLEKLKTEGKIRHYGVSHIQFKRMEAYFNTGTVFSAMMEFSAVARSAREKKLSLCLNNGIGVIAFSTTGRGLLTGKIKLGHTFEEDDIRHIDSLFQRERFVSGLRVAEQFQVLSQEYEKTPVQIAIAWVLAQPGVICALTGPSTIPHLEENLGASGWSLTSNDLEALDLFFAEEDQRLQRDQKQTLCAILEDKLVSESAFTDLVYVFETLVENGWAMEQSIMPLFTQLYALRKQEGLAVLEQMKTIQAELREQFLLILSDASPPQNLFHDEIKSN